MLISSALQDFLRDQRCRGNSPKTVDYYSTVVGYFIHYVGDPDVACIDLRMLQDYRLSLDDLGLSSVSIQSYVRGLRSFISWLFDNDYIDTDYCLKFKLPKAQRKVKDVLTDDEILKLLYHLSGSDWLSRRNYLICCLFLDCGLRLSELVSLKIDDVHLSERYLIVTGKGDKQRIVPFGQRCFESFKSWFDLRVFRFHGGHGFLFVQEHDSGFYYVPITYDTVKMLFRRLKQRVDIPRISPHLLRHTFATRYLENGGNIYALQAILGHSSLEIVKQYLHLANSRIRSDFTKFSPLDRLEQISFEIPP